MAPETLFPHSLKNQVNVLFEDAFERCGAPRASGSVFLSQKPELGDFQCNGAMASARALGKKPRDIAEEVVAAVGHPPLLESLNIAGPGFINARVANESLAALVDANSRDERHGLEKVQRPRRIVLDFGGPNVAKPMHVGHLRSSIIGDSLQRLFRFLGHDVISDIHLGDWGTQMGMLIEALKKKMPELPYWDPVYTGPFPSESPVTIEDLQRLYPEASSLCKSDAAELEKAQKATAELQEGRPGYRAIWRHFVEISKQELREDFGLLDIRFDKWFGESDYHEELAPMVEALRSGGHAMVDNGATIIPVAEETDKKEIPPLLLVKSDGGYLYATTDLATIQQRARDFAAEEILYVVDKRQGLHFEQVFRAAAKSGLAGNATMEHLAFGTMNGSDGRPFKTREGGVMRLRDLIRLMTDEAHKRMEEGHIAEEFSPEERAEIARRVGLASLKFADLQNLRTSDYIFDPVKFTRFEGRTGAYLCYAAVRIKSILRKAEERGLAPAKVQPAVNPADRALQLQLALLPDAVATAAETRMPHHLCASANDLATTFNQFYNQCHILSEEDAARRGSWLQLCVATLRQLEFLLSLLGIETPERM